MSVHHRKLKVIEFALDSTNYECQVQTWRMVNNTEDQDKQYTFCPDGEFREDGEDNYALELTFFADWRSAGISEFLWQHDKQEVPFTLDHHPDIPDEHVRWTGVAKIKAPNVGGEARSTEVHEITLNVQGKPEFTRVGV